MNDRFMLTDEALTYAELHEKIEVTFNHTQQFGWDAHVHSTVGVCLLTFPWTDNIDQVLAHHSESLPFAAGLDPVWADQDEGWHAEVAVVGPYVFVAQSFVEPYLRVPAGPTSAVGNYWDLPTVLPIPGVSKGRVRINNAEATVYSVPKQEWERAWASARDACVAGKPEPSVSSWSDC